MTHTEMGYSIRISRCFNQYREKCLEHLDLHLKPSQLMIISNVCRHPGLTQDDLSDSLCLDKTTTSHHIANLEKQGYLKREASLRDGRYKEVYPTEKALELSPALHQTYRDFFIGLIGDLPEEERVILSRSLEKMYDHAIEMAKEGVHS